MCHFATSGALFLNGSQALAGRFFGGSGVPRRRRDACRARRRFLPRFASTRGVTQSASPARFGRTVTRTALGLAAVGGSGRASLRCACTMHLGGISLCILRSIFGRRTHFELLTSLRLSLLAWGCRAVAPSVKYGSV